MQEHPTFVVIQDAKKKNNFIPIPLDQTYIRWIALALACFLLFGDSYAFDNPMSLQSTIQSQMDLNNIQFNLLYSVYSIPNIILPFFGGMLIDRLGVRFSIITFSGLLVIGQLVVVFAAYQLSYYTMLVGRAIFGGGSESLNAAQVAIMSQWFRGRGVSLALGMCMSIPKLGSAINSFLSPLVQAEYNSLGFTMLISFFIVIFSFICGLLLVKLDSENQDRKEKYVETLLNNNRKLIESNIDIDLIQVQKEKKHNDFKELETITHQFIISPVLDFESDTPLYDTLLQTPSTEVQKLSQENYKKEQIQIKEEINFANLGQLGGSFWILAFIVMLSEALFVPFLDNGNAFVQVKYGFSQQQAGILLTIPYILASIITPIFGITVDKIRRRTILIIITSVIFCITHLLLLLIDCSSTCKISAIPLVMLGLCYALYSSILIPSIPLVVQPQMIGTAFGLVGVFQNTALAIFPLLTGSIYNSHIYDNQGNIDEKQGYFYQSIFFVSMSSINLFVAILLHVFDIRGHQYLSIKASNL